MDSQLKFFHPLTLPAVVAMVLLRLNQGSTLMLKTYQRTLNLITLILVMMTLQEVTVTGQRQSVRRAVDVLAVLSSCLFSSLSYKALILHYLPFTNTF